MSIIDNELYYSNTPQEINGDAISENVYDQDADVSGRPVKDVIGGKPMYLVMVVTEAFNAPLIDMTVTFESSAAAGLTTPRVHASRNLLLADLTINTVHVIGVPVGEPSLRYTGVRYDCNGNPTLGKVKTWLTDTPPQNPPS